MYALWNLLSSIFGTFGSFLFRYRSEIEWRNKNEFSFFTRNVSHVLQYWESHERDLSFSTFFTVWLSRVGK